MPHTRVYEPNDIVVNSQVLVSGNPIYVYAGSYTVYARGIIDLDRLKTTGANHIIRMRAIMNSSQPGVSVWMRLYNQTDAQVITAVAVSGTAPYLHDIDVSTAFAGRTGTKVIEVQAYITNTDHYGVIHFVELTHKAVIVVKP